MFPQLVRFWFVATLSSAWAVTEQDLDQLDWIVGTWRSEHDGKTRWPTTPTITYGEELIVAKAPTASATGVHFLNFSARAWAHPSGDPLHDEWGYLAVNRSAIATLMATGSNGFNKFEQGPVSYGFMRLDLTDIGRISFSRDLPVHDLRRTFRLLGSDYMEQLLEMRTETHPRNSGLMEHGRIVYRKIRS